MIANNRGRKEKSLWTENGEGELIRLRQFDTAFDEADFIGEDIKSAVRQGGSYNDSAVLYRTNAQSRLLEEKFIAMNIPYKIVGGVNFYARREIKDLLAYLKKSTMDVMMLRLEESLMSQREESVLQQLTGFRSLRQNVELGFMRLYWHRG